MPWQGGAGWAAAAVMVVAHTAETLTPPFPYDGLLLLSVLLGVPAVHALARVIRPHAVHATLADRVRHGVAAVGVAGGIPTLMLGVWENIQEGFIGGGTSALFYFGGLPALLALLVSVPWGAGALLVRLVRR